MMIRFAQRLVGAPGFEYGIVALIVGNGVLLGMETFPDLVRRYGEWMRLGNHVVLALFILEALFKMLALAPKVDRYFRDGWNVFDFSVIVCSLIPASGDYAMIARLARLLRVLRLISAMPELRLIVSTLVRSIPSMGHVLLLMSIIFYIYAIAGYQLFHDHDPTHWRNLGIALLSLFRIVTLEDWTDIMYTAMVLHPMAWIYFLSFVVVGTFVVINLFIAVVINNLDEAKAERLQALEPPASPETIARDLRAIQKTLRRLESRFERHEP